jgi:heme o synthase
LNKFIIIKISSSLQLCRPKIAIFASLSAGFGFVLAGRADLGYIASLLSGVFMLASGASGLNLYQERDTDALMARTKERPIPSGRINPMYVLYFSATCMIAGICIIYLFCGSVSAAIGLLAAVWYNGVYTNLKKKSAFAAVPGGLTGSLVPAIGWTAGGGRLDDPHLAVISVLFGLWQVPHFWLLALEHGSEYEAAGLPSITRVFSFRQISRITFVWITATAVCALILVLFQPPSSITYYLTLCASFWLIWQGGRFMISGGEKSRLYFLKLNGYMLVLMTLLCCDSLYSHSIDRIVAIAK